MLDRESYPASEMIPLYHERWELELGYDEIKTEMLDREETIRSRNPKSVRQEIGARRAPVVRVQPRALGDGARRRRCRSRAYADQFITALHLICDEWLWSASA